MIWPFQKAHDLPDGKPVDGGWAISEGDYDGAPIVIRINEGYAGLAPIRNFSYQVGIAVPFNDAQETGMPGAGEVSELDSIEDSVIDIFESEPSSLLVAIITTGGMREFVLYTSDPEDAKSDFERLEGSITSHKPQLIIQEDKGWSVYKQFA